MRSFSLIEHASSPGCRRILIEGELDLAVADQLRRALGRAERSRRVVVDLEHCDFIDLAAVALLLRAGREGEGPARNPRVTIHGARGQPLRLLTVLGLADALVLREPQGSLP